MRAAPFFSVLLGDSQSYDAWAQRIAGGDWLGNEVFYQAPLYPYVLGAVYSVAGHDLWIARLCQAGVGSLSCVLLALAGARLFSRPVGIVAGFVLALYAPAIFFDALVQKSTLNVFLLCLTLWIVARIVTGADRLTSWAALGVTLGCLALTRENALALAAVVLAWIGIQYRALGPRRLALAAVFIAGLLAVLAPVAVRNTLVGGELHLTTMQFGPNFYIGNNPGADGTYRSLRYGRGSPEYERQDAVELAERATGRRLTPGEVSSFWTREALAYITTQPGDWLGLLVRKLALVANAVEVIDTESQATHAEWSTILRVTGYVGHFGVIVPLAALGVWLTWGQRQRLWLLYAMGLTYAGTLLVFYVFARYRFPLVPLVVLFAAAAIAELPRFLRVGSPLRLASGAVLVGVFAILCNWPMLSEDLMRAVTEHNLGTALQAEGRLDVATGHYRRAIQLQPDYAPAYSNLGTALRQQGRLDEAVSQYRTALRLVPNYAEAHYNLANALAALGRPDEAVPHYRRALELGPDAADIYNNLGIALATEGRLDDAMAEFRAALRLDPASVEAHSNLGGLLATTGATDEAVRHLREALRLRPDHAPAHYELANVLLTRGDLAEAIAEYRRALDIEPASPETHNNLGFALASQDRLDEAFVHFERALEIDPSFADARNNLMALRAREAREP